MKFIPSMLALAAIVALVPAAQAQSKLGHGKDSDKAKESSAPKARSGGDKGAGSNRGSSVTPVKNKPVERLTPTSASTNNDAGARSRDNSQAPRENNYRSRGNDNRIEPIAPIRAPRQEPYSTSTNNYSAVKAYSSSGSAPSFSMTQSKLGRGKGSGGGGGGSSSGGGSRSGGNSGSNGGSRSDGNSNGDQGRLRDNGSSVRGDEGRQPRRTESRSGTVNYQSRSNNPVSRDQHPVRISNSPVVTVSGNGRMERGAGRQPQTHVNRDRDRDRGFRNGYWQYRNNWTDSYFHYPHYQFNYVNGYYPSPWYYYTNLPGYIDPSRCLNTVSVNFGWGLGIRYSWSNHHTVYYGGGYDYRSRDSDYELDRSGNDIESAFRNRDIRQMDDLIARGGNVEIDIEGQQPYSLGSDDFYDLINDAITATQTRSYSIVDVYKNRYEATIVADHSFVDAWGGTITQRHWYGLVRDGSGYRIISFRTAGI